MGNMFGEKIDYSEIQLLEKQTIVVKSDVDLSYIQLNVLEFLGDKANPRDLNRVKIVLSELGTNILKYAGKGKIILSVVRRLDSFGLQIEAVDAGAGIIDVEKAMQDHYSTGKSLGLGLPGVKRMSDAFHIYSDPEIGTHITLQIWFSE